ncbi:MAG: GyrI-like domain-containing protein [Treponema sp.]|nr:GyrI-like domain-containing protein [Treponema sp.]
MSKPSFVTFQMHLDEYSILGNENILTESPDFGTIWGNFFKKGGYDPILPFAADPKPINVWYTNKAGEKIYFQGLLVNKVDKVPEGYTLVKFPASDFLVVTYEWVPKQDYKEMDEINGGWKYIETLQIPNGYARYDGPGSPITIIEKDSSDSPEGSRYEFWVPIRKIG